MGARREQKPPLMATVNLHALAAGQQQHAGISTIPKMIRRRWAVALVVVVCLAACSQPAESTPPDPKALLAASTAGLAAGNYRYTSDMPGNIVEGVTDLASRSAAWTGTLLDPGRTEVETRVIGQDQYTRTRYDATSAADEKKRLRKAAAATDDPYVKADLAAQLREIETGDNRYRHLDLSLDHSPGSALSRSATAWSTR
jgi:hypothetical protein